MTRDGDRDTQSRLEMKKEEKELCDQNDRRRTVNPMIIKEQGRRQTRQTRQTRQKKKCHRCERDVHTT